MTQRNGKRREMLDGVPIAGYYTPDEAAVMAGYTPRHLANLRQRGLPAVRDGAGWRYPYPHFHIWHESYQRHLRHSGSVWFVPFEVAVAERALAEAEFAAERAGRSLHVGRMR